MTKPFPTLPIVRRRIPLMVAGGLAVGLAALVLAVRWPGAIPEIPPPTDTKAVALGARVYADQCANCHGGDLEGEPDWRRRKPDGRLPAPPHDATGHTWHHSDDVLFRIVKEGMQPFAPEGYVTDMPAFEGVLSDAEIGAVLAYIQSTWPPDIRTRQAAISGSSR